MTSPSVGSRGTCKRRKSLSGTVEDAEGNSIDYDRQIFTPRSFRIRLLDVLHGFNMWTPYVLAALFVFAVSRIVPVPTTTSDLSKTSTVLFGLAQGWGVYLRQQWLSYSIIAACMYWLVSTKRPVYLIDFAVFEPPKSWVVTKTEVLDLLRRQGCYSEESMEFQARLLERNGTGESTHWPPSIVQLIRPEVALLRDELGQPRIPEDGRVDNSIDQARAVAEVVMFSW